MYINSSFIWTRICNRASITVSHGSPLLSVLDVRELLGDLVGAAASFSDNREF